MESTPSEMERAQDSYPITVEFGRINRVPQDCYWIGIHPIPRGARAVLYNGDQPLRSWLFSSVEYALIIARQALYVHWIDGNAERILVLEDGVWHRGKEHA